MYRNNNSKRLIRFAILGLALVIVALVALSFAPAPVLLRLFGWWGNRPPDPTPLPPTITAPQGAPPVNAVGLQEYAREGSGDYHSIGSGFLLRLTNGTIVAVTTAHSVGDLGNPDNAITQLAFQQAGQSGYVVESNTLYGQPGVPRWGEDMTVDWLLLKVDSEVDPTLVLEADPRSKPQEGERVILYSGRGDGVMLGGTIQSVYLNAFWALMDPTDYPGGMSGSPLISAYTGKVVGMAIATAARGDRYLMGFHPIGSIVDKANAADLFVTIEEFRK